MRFVRSGMAIAAGFVVFSIIFTILGPGLGAVLTTAAAGVFAGYLVAKVASAHELAHGGATAGLVAASVVAQTAFPLGVRIVVATLAVVAISAGAWIRAHAKIDRPENMAEDSQRPEGEGGEERP